MSITGTHPLDEDLVACTGCAACAAVCPEYCITMRSDAEGFLYPHVNKAVCKDCGLCHETCPINSVQLALKDSTTDAKQNGPLQVFAAWHLDEAIRRESSSGGVFTALAEAVFAQSGAVVGAAFDNNLVVRHILIENSADLERLRGSKYVQSEVPPIMYQLIRDLLMQSRPVLFSGTPCQVAGLRSFLRKPYDNLFCCDIVCHGVPSPLLFARYTQYCRQRGEQLTTISFRDKQIGWKKFGVRHYLQDGGSRFFAASAEPYLLAFLRNYDLRESCYTCVFACTQRTGDLTIADFWGVGKKYPEYDQEDKGTSLVLVNTVQGHIWLDSVRTKLFLGPADMETAIAGNSNLVGPCTRPHQRDTFFNDLKVCPYPIIIRKYRLHAPTILNRIYVKIRRKIKSGVKRLIYTQE